MTNQLLEKGQLWYVVMPGGVACSQVRVIEVTVATVVLAAYSGWPNRYPISSIQWIELIKEDQ